MAEPKEIWPTDEISAAVVDMTQKVSEEPDAYLHFLQLQAHHPQYTADTLLWLMAKEPDDQVFRTVPEWNEHGRFVKPGEKGIPLERGMVRLLDHDGWTNPNMEWVFAAKQTWAKESIPPEPEQRLSGQRLEMGLRTLLELSPVEVKIDTGASSSEIRYDPERKEILLPQGIGAEGAFRGLVREILQARMDMEMDEGYRREIFQQDAECLSWMMCQRYGLPCPEPDLSRLAQNNAPWNTEERNSCLTSISWLYSGMEKNVSREVNIQKSVRQKIGQAMGTNEHGQGKSKALVQTR